MMEKMICSKSTIDFLLFSYFGITLEDAKDTADLIDVAIRSAYTDATMQGAYNALFSKDDHKAKIETASREAYTICAERLKVDLKKLSDFKTQNEYDQWHSEMCDFIIFMCLLTATL